MQYNPVAAAATAGYVGLAESRAAAVDSNTSRLLLVRARRNLGSAVVCQLIVLILCCAALAVPWSRITQYDSDGDAAITFSLYAGGKVVTCYPNLPGVSCQDSTTSDLAGEGWAAGPMLDVSSKASMGLVILMMLFSLFSIFAIAALRKRILVAAATASIAPAVTVPGRLAWSMRPFTPLYTLYIVGTLSTLNWLQFVICGKNFYVSAVRAQAVGLATRLKVQVLQPVCNSSRKLSAMLPVRRMCDSSSMFLHQTSSDCSLRVLCRARMRTTFMVTPA